MSGVSGSRQNLDGGDAAAREALLLDVTEGLRQKPKRIAPKFFYDAQGSRLFEAICDTPEYYLSRTEHALLRRYAHELAGLVGPNSVVIEPGSGSCRKIRLLLDALRPARFVPMEICAEELACSARALSTAFPWLELLPVCADFTVAEAPPIGPGRRLVFFPGSTLGNFEPREAGLLLQRFAGWTGPGGAVLIGVDLKKPRSILDAAYNDAAGLTAAFNLNLLARLNRELEADFRLDRFLHQAWYNEHAGRVEMHLRSVYDQRVHLRENTFLFEAGESIHTENSYKYTVQQFHELAEEAGLIPKRVWTDADQLFSLHYLEVPNAF